MFELQDDYFSKNNTTSDMSRIIDQKWSFPYYVAYSHTDANLTHSGEEIEPDGQ